MTVALLSPCTKFGFFVHFFKRENFSYLYLTLGCVCCASASAICFSKHFIGGWFVTDRLVRSVLCYVYFSCMHFLEFPLLSGRLFHFYFNWKSVTIKFCQICSLLLLRQRFYTFIFSRSVCPSLSDKAHFFSPCIQLSSGKYAMCQFSLGTFNIVYLY